MNWLSEAQVQSALRHLYSVLGTAIACVITFGLLDPTTADQVVRAVHDIGDGLAKIAGALGVLVPIAMSLWAAFSARLSKRATDIAATGSVIVVPPTAPQTLLDLAHDDKVKGIVPAFPVVK